MSEDLDKERRDRRAKQARDRRRKRGLKRSGDGGGAGKSQGRKMEERPDRPTCCDRLMVSIGRSWRCKICKTTKRKSKENKMMTENEFCNLLNYSKGHKTDEVLTIDRAIKLMHDALSCLMPDDEDQGAAVVGSTVLWWGELGIITKDSNGKIFHLCPDADGEFYLRQAVDDTFIHLQKSDSLGKVFASAAIAEFGKLQAEATGLEKERLEYNRLKAKFENTRS